MAEFQVLTTKRGGKSLIIDDYVRFHQTCAKKKQDNPLPKREPLDSARPGSLHNELASGHMLQ